MSSLLILVLFSLCCLQACGGRLLSVDVQHNIGDRSLRSRSLHHSSEEEVRESVSTTLLPEAAPSFMAAEPRSVRSLGKRAAAGEGAMEEGKHGGGAVETAEDLEASEEGGDGATGTAAPGVIQTESIGTVSWQVPRDSHRGHPGFNIDYDAPRTHPPSHN
ncbi:hypothetical protein Taro_037218 [Colocasia esculenta]|uniref:Uncharacterized protein n=1 Tax=Colocasia esculenta TaxID=4460 RepID=A0A843WFM2_COLES|nr:hypothetical protein [Colocasia esculenta]